MRADYKLTLVSCAELRALQLCPETNIFWCVHDLAGDASFPVDSQHVFHINLSTWLHNTLLLLLLLCASASLLLHTRAYC